METTNGAEMLRSPGHKIIKVQQIQSLRATTSRLGRFGEQFATGSDGQTEREGVKELMNK